MIKTPILLVHGEEDRVVLPLRSRYMADELDDYDKVYKYVELESGDHNLSIQRNRHIFFKEMCNGKRFSFRVTPVKCTSIYDKILLGWRLFNQVSGILNKAR